VYEKTTSQDLAHMRLGPSRHLHDVGPSVCRFPQQREAGRQVYIALEYGHILINGAVLVMVLIAFHSAKKLKQNP
jgi:hypothetical protein